MATGFSISEIFWDHQKYSIKRNYARTESISRLNTLLLKEEARANDILNKLSDQDKLNYLSIVEVKNRITRNSTYESFFEFGNSVVEDLKAAHRCGTARHYKGILPVLKTFNKGKYLKFNEVNYSFIKRYEKYHLAKGNSWNGLSTYLRGLRALFNKGIKAGLIEKEAYPFMNYTIREIPTEKRALEIENIRKILELEIPKDQALFRY